MGEVKAKVKASDHEDYSKYTLLAFILPVVGLILGIGMLLKDKEADKKLGEHLIAISILFGLVWWFVWSWFISNQVTQTVPVYYP